MSNLIKRVTDKMYEFGLNILKIDQMDENQYTVLNDYMVIFIFPKENIINISFQATTRPDDAARLILIIKEIAGTEVQIMESFIYNTEHKLVSGEDAFDLIKESIGNEAVQKYRQAETYEYLLNNVECFKC